MRSCGPVCKWIRMVPWLVIAVTVIVLDQWSKWAVVRHFEETRTSVVKVIDGCFDFIVVHNYGAAFSFLSGAGGWQRYFLLAFGVAVCFWLIYMIFRSPGQKIACLSLSLILGGAIGNMIDRARLGGVVDFIDWYLYGKHFPTFNVADIAITIGVSLLLIDAFFCRKKIKKQKDSALT